MHININNINISGAPCQCFIYQNIIIIICVQEGVLLYERI